MGRGIERRSNLTKTGDGEEEEDKEEEGERGKGGKKREKW